MATNFPTGLDSYTTLIDNVDDVLASHMNDKGSAIAALEAKMGINNSAVTTSFDYFLKHASGTFKTHSHNGTDSAKFTIANMSDANISAPSNNQLLRYNTTTSKGENATITQALTNLTDVTISTPATRESIYYNGSSWQNGNPNAVYAS